MSAGDPFITELSDTNPTSKHFSGASLMDRSGYTAVNPVFWATIERIEGVVDEDFEISIEARPSERFKFHQAILLKEVGVHQIFLCLNSLVRICLVSGSGKLLVGVNS